MVADELNQSPRAPHLGRRQTSLPSIIFLNGASSAGKTTLGRALQASLAEPYLLMGLDTCLAMVPAEWSGGPLGAHRAQGFQYLDLPHENGKPVSGLSHGPVGLRMLKGFHRAVREFVHAGNRVIVDEMMLGADVRDHWLTTLAGLDVLWVAVHCDLPELERRELARRGRVGLARWSADRVHEGMTYNLSVNTTTRSPEACARQIASAASEA
ncbi:chloramphenicol phosphotransferase [Kribbella turkmenica]|uniref:Chloramphenicol phosphotransferase n=1 Tax=Kribbella turkmenica TaxID=2530375 RepID=A0A4R4WT58_9ACTN|nr:AAA family ATPase [Kribbella turkmenica]TDD20776.1 chloramphenicol phosphotransferase [Kribbella turkmenica]